MSVITAQIKAPADKHVLEACMHVSALYLILKKLETQPVTRYLHTYNHIRAHRRKYVLNLMVHVKCTIEATHTGLEMYA